MKRRHKEEQDNYLTEREAMVMRCICRRKTLLNERRKDRFITTGR